MAKSLPRIFLWQHSHSSIRANYGHFVAGRQLLAVAVDRGPWSVGWPSPVGSDALAQHAATRCAKGMSGQVKRAADAGQSQSKELAFVSCAKTCIGMADGAPGHCKLANCNCQPNQTRKPTKRKQTPPRVESSRVELQNTLTGSLCRSFCPIRVANGFVLCRVMSACTRWCGSQSLASLARHIPIHYANRVFVSRV